MVLIRSCSVGNEAREEEERGEVLARLYDVPLGPELVPDKSGSEGVAGGSGFK